MKEQTSRTHLERMISTNVKTQNLPLFRVLPLFVKDALLRVINYFYGERSSCMSISNLGEITYPEEMSQYIERVDFVLSPRGDHSCNCGIISYNGLLFINFTRKSKTAELEQRFFKCLDDLGCPAKIEVLVDERSMEHELTKSIDSNKNSLSTVFRTVYVMQ